MCMRMKDLSKESEIRTKLEILICWRRERQPAADTHFSLARDPKQKGGNCIPVLMKSYISTRLREATVLWGKFDTLRPPVRNRARKKLSHPF